MNMRGAKIIGKFASSEGAEVRFSTGHKVNSSNACETKACSCPFAQHAPLPAPGEKMAPLCREFDISRKTGYKIFERYKDCGLAGLTDRSRGGHIGMPTSCPFQIEKLIVELKQERPSWGAPKIREKLRRLYPDVQMPAISTVHAVLDRHGLVKRRRRRRYKAEGTALSRPLEPNDLWCADYKGEFMLADRRYCYPLTITDFASRYLLACEALATTKEAYRLHRVRARLQGVRPARGHPHRQRRSLRQPQCPLRPQQALGLVAAAGHRHRAHQARLPAAERPPRAHASDPEAGGHQAGRANFLQQQAGSTTSSTATTTSGRTRRSTCSIRPSATPFNATLSRACPSSTTRSTTRPSL